MKLKTGLFWSCGSANLAPSEGQVITDQASHPHHPTVNSLAENASSRSVPAAFSLAKAFELS